MTTTRHLASIPTNSTAGPTVGPAAPGPMLETLLAQSDNKGAIKALTAVSDLMEWLAVVVDGNAAALSNNTPDQLAAAQYRRDATLYRRLSTLLRKPLDTPTDWYDALITAFDGRFTEEALTR